MRCPICGYDIKSYSFHVVSCPNCDYNGSTFNPLYDRNKVIN